MPSIVPLPKACILPGFLPASSPSKTFPGRGWQERGEAFISQSYDVDCTTQKGMEVLAVPLPGTSGERGQKVTEAGRRKSWGDIAPQHVKVA